MNSCGRRWVRHSWNSAGTTLRWARSPVEPNRTNTAGSGTRPRRSPSRSGFSSGLLAAARRFDSVASRRSRIVRGWSFLGAAGAGVDGAAGAATLAFVFVVMPIAARRGLVSLDRVAAELVTQRCEDTGPVGVVLARPEPRLQAERDDRRGDVLVDRLLD